MRTERFRVGIDVAEIVEDGDIHGDGVNVAARLEGLAEPAENLRLVSQAGIFCRRMVEEIITALSRIRWPTRTPIDHVSGSWVAQRPLPGVRMLASGRASGAIRLGKYGYAEPLHPRRERQPPLRREP
jgi:hypothetical protein